MTNTVRHQHPPKDITDRILRQENYTATVHIWFPFLLPDTLVQKILNTCLLPEMSKYHDAVSNFRWKKGHKIAYHMPKNPWYIAKLTLQYPTNDTFRLVARLEADTLISWHGIVMA